MIAKDIFLTQQDKEKLSEAKKEDKPEPLQIEVICTENILKRKHSILITLFFFRSAISIISMEMML